MCVLFQRNLNEGKLLTHYSPNLMQMGLLSSNRYLLTFVERTFSVRNRARLIINYLSTSRRCRFSSIKKKSKEYIRYCIYSNKNILGWLKSPILISLKTKSYWWDLELQNGSRYQLDHPTTQVWWISFSYINCSSLINV